ncbi:Sec63 Brl domain-containing protein [Fimicolochytrium jonesii]|uniref:Sec63 Brl domain-containing protein n=1 Tax=Fimicolochytrium jonesii TaxID=1396493 RepID=UPI0022FF0642|nr:Sec63 Brl domain-containing protein [Fimicolochytrium jonesii]KAI8815603.1 Sec63 Brl domain-containing protein [Fimicolochytrium jonesii]
MAQYAYDETGAVFNYFVLTVLAFVLFPYTFSGLFSRGNGATAADGCNCDQCQQKRVRLALAKKKETPLISTRFILLALGWTLFGFVLYSAATTSLEEKGIWDPYKVLGLEPGASVEDVKAAKRGLFFKYHPDKNPDREEWAAEQMAEVNKALKTLTNDEARKNWEEWGHPDGKQSFQLGLALPKWLVEESNSFKVLFVYTAVFMVLLPALVARWWSKAKVMNKDKILNPTMGKFYRDLKASMGFKPLMELIAKADEFYTTISLDPRDNAALEKLNAKVKSVMEETTSDRWNKKVGTAKDAATAMQQKVYLLLVSHMLRIVPSDAKLANEQRIVAETSATLIGGLLQIAQSRQWLNIALAVVDLGQMISQALYIHQSPILQLPNITADKLKHFKSKKREVTTIRDLLEKDEKEQARLLEFLSEGEKEKTLSVAEQYPLLRITKAKFSVLGEPAIIPNAIVTLIVKLDLASPSEIHTDIKLSASTTPEDDDEDDSKEPSVNWWDTSKPPTRIAHAPYYPTEKRPVWWIYFGDMNQNRLITVAKVNDLIKEKVVRLQFQAPPRPGSWDFQVFVKSDSHVGCDALCELKLVVQPPEAAPLIEEDDDISEPEEDSLAGQMAAMKSGGAPPPRRSKSNGKTNGHAADDDDSSDDESSSESEEEERAPVRKGRKKERETGGESDYEDSESSGDDE